MDGYPDAVAFDVVGTLFSLENLRPRLVAAGLPGHALEVWFARLLRDAFALDATGVYKAFEDVAMATLESLLVASGAEAGAAATIIEGFAAMDAYPDAAPALHALREADVGVVALTNGSASTTAKLLARGQLADLVERVISIDEVRCWKPHRDVYLHCTTSVQSPPDRVALVAAHGWDIHGASRAGLVTGYVSRDGNPFPASMDPPDVVGTTLVDVAERLINVA